MWKVDLVYCSSADAIGPMKQRYCCTFFKLKYRINSIIKVDSLMNRGKNVEACLIHIFVLLLESK